MPPRRKPISTKKKKEQQKLKKAIKRGEVEKLPPQPRKKKVRGKSALLTNNQNAIERVKKLQSSFVRPSQEYMAASQIWSSNVALERPIPADLKNYDPTALQLRRSIDVDSSPLTCMKRPKWRYEMSKTEVEKNEEGMFKKWIDGIDEHLEILKSSDDNRDSEVEAEQLNEEISAFPNSPTYYERNLEVWRQLWRVTELSSLLIILMDARCPLVHLPPSLISYLESYCPSSDVAPDEIADSSSKRSRRLRRRTKSVVLILTKADIPPLEMTAAWVSHLRESFPNWPVACVQSYYQKEEGWSEQGLNNPKYLPGLESDVRKGLIEVLRSAHLDLINVPEGHKMPTNVRQNVDWDSMLNVQNKHSVDDVQELGTSEDDDGYSEGGNSDVEDAGDSSEPEHLTIGLIGQPNVGKSSLLNALFGTSKVRASKTPGKTKHFQTHFLSREIRIVDCPGLVFPSYTRMEAQVLCGILPIARMNAILGCISWIAMRLSLESVLRLQHPDVGDSNNINDKRTWREEGPKHKSNPDALRWTAMDILTSYAARNGWLTAKAGREDVMRAGNAILRSLAEGRIKWAFWPSGHEQDTEENAGDGILVSSALMEETHAGDDDMETEEDDGNDSEVSSESQPGPEDHDSEEVERGTDTDSSPSASGAEVQIGGRFAALSLPGEE